MLHLTQDLIFDSHRSNFDFFFFFSLVITNQQRLIAMVGVKENEPDVDIHLHPRSGWFARGIKCILN